VNLLRNRVGTVVFVLIIASIARCPALAAAVAEASSHSEVRLTKQRVLILGDSITQDGRYVSYLEYYLHKIAPGEKTDIISIGLSSETVSGLSEKSHPFPRPCALDRLERALKLTKPHVVLACYGMNDGIYHPSSPERLAAFNRGIRQLISQVHASDATLVLITPPVFDAAPIHAKTVARNAASFGYDHPYEGYDDVLTEFSQAELTIHEPGTTVIDLHSAYLSALTARRHDDPKFTFAPDGVHPNDEGHRLIARVVLQNLGYVPPEDSVLKIQAEPLFALVREKRQLRSESWLPFVGYSRGENFKSASVTASELVVARLQREIDAYPIK